MSKTSARLSGTALLYVSPWVMWLLLLPLALIFWWMASAGQAAAFALGGATLAAGGALGYQCWNAFAPRGQQAQFVATGTFGFAFAWLCATTMFGLFHHPGWSPWPEFWRAPEWLLASFTLPIWGSWFFLMAMTSIGWNMARAGQKRKEDGDERTEKETPDELGKILDGSTLKVDAIVGKPDAPVIKVTAHGVPGRHTGEKLMSNAPDLESLHGLRPGAIRPAPDYDNASKAKYTITPKDPLKGDLTWAGPQHPGSSIADFPCLPGVYTDGAEIEHWLPGDDAGGRPLQHLAVAGVNGSGKSAGLKIDLTEALCRIDTKVCVADISGKIWQTFGALMPYLTKVAGLNGIEDEDREQNTLDALDLIKWVEKDAMERQQRWGKLGINQWEARCFTEFGDAFGILVIEEASELLEQMPDDVERIAKKIRSAGWLLVVVAQRFSFDQIPTTLRAQLPGRFVFGQADSRDSGMILPDDVHDILGRSPANDPGTWNSTTPGKAIVCIPGQPAERRSDPTRFFWATNEKLAEYLGTYGRRLWTDEEIEEMKNDNPPAGIVVRTQSARTPDREAPEGFGTYVQTPRTKATRPRAYVRDDVRTDEGATNVHDIEADVRTSRVHETSVYADPELEGMNVEIDGPIECPPEYAGVTMEQSGYEGTGVSLPRDEFRIIVQKHLASLLAQGCQEVRPADVLRLQPPAGSRQRILAELKRLADSGAEDEHTVERSETQPGHWLIRAPRALPVTVSG